MNTISGMSGAGSAWSEMKSSRVERAPAPSATSNDDDGLGSIDIDIEISSSPVQGERDPGMDSLMSAPNSTMKFALQSDGMDGMNDISGTNEPSTGDDREADIADVAQALNSFVDLVMKQYGQADASSAMAGGDSLDVSA